MGANFPTVIFDLQQFNSHLNVMASHIITYEICRVWNTMPTCMMSNTYLYIVIIKDNANLIKNKSVFNTKKNCLYNAISTY